MKITVRIASLPKLAGQLGRRLRWRPGPSGRKAARREASADPAIGGGSNYARSALPGTSNLTASAEMRDLLADPFDEAAAPLHRAITKP